MNNVLQYGTPDYCALKIMEAMDRKYKQLQKEIKPVDPLKFRIELMDKISKALNGKLFYE